MRVTTPAGMVDSLFLPPADTPDYRGAGRFPNIPIEPNLPEIGRNSIMPWAVIIQLFFRVLSDFVPNVSLTRKIPAAGWFGPAGGHPGAARRRREV